MEEHHDTQAPQYLLPGHVYLCKTVGGMIFLDLRRDRYFGLSGPQMHALASVVAGWPIQDTPVADVPLDVELQGCRVADLMVQRGLLTTDTHAGKSATPVVLELAQTAIGGSKRQVSTERMRLLDLARFITAWTRTAWMLRRKPLETVVSDVANRKQRNGHAAPAARELMEIVSIFRRLRRYAFTATDRCLFHALVLINFLSLYGHFPTWVIGVRSIPWGAHSWVQDGACVLDSTPEEIAAYTPILTV